MKTVASRLGLGARRTPIDPRAPGLTMPAAVSYFARRPSAIFLFAMLVLALAVRLWLGEFRVWDAVLAASLVGIHPLTEWFIHVDILHFRPRTWRGHAIDLAVARDHRAHHVDPHEPRWWFIPMRSLLSAFVAVVTLSTLLMPTLPLAGTAIATMTALGLVYEWTHYLCHSSWRPRSAFYRELWKLHRLHHFKNENYWMGVTMHAGDRLMGTLPEVGDVETSPTCRNLDDR
ncbi:MAG: sterol desaturase family protein [Deltaproteobacteria bacterium]|nr:sterol desaturase family protein [Deltaproteobacteria bacterium]MBK8239397.1 sterol desaturase family protein [Deltaproteobacteria bacterium]MBK8720258.1 sterol desaturase family protein [Deltaproteobacteria bacterium]MBP7287628.1 sterol desaturase family protein [Nannocystaceae bacterium]